MDELSADKSLLRVTTDRIPSNHGLSKDLGIPLALLIKPFGHLSQVIRISHESLDSGYSKPLRAIDMLVGSLELHMDFRVVLERCRIDNVKVEGNRLVSI